MKIVELISKYIVVPAAFLYLAGWIYLDTLCRYVGLDVSLLSLDTNAIIMNSYNVIDFLMSGLIGIVQEHPYALTAICGSVLAIYFIPATRRLMRRALNSRPSRQFRVVASRNSWFQAVLLLLMAFGIAFESQTAAKGYLAQMPARPGARMIFDFSASYVSEAEQNCKSNDGCYYQYLKAANDSASLRMLLETSEYFVVWAQHPTPNRSLGEVYLIKKGNVALAGAMDVETCWLGRKNQCGGF